MYGIVLKESEKSLKISQQVFESLANLNGVLKSLRSLNQAWNSFKEILKSFEHVGRIFRIYSGPSLEES